MNERGEVVFEIDKALEIFVGRDRRGQRFRFGLRGRPSVKDVFEAVGIPHPEVEALEINGVPGDFGSRVSPGDFIRLWHGPSTHTMLPLRPPLQKPPRFLLDVHLHRLASWLRIFGFDTILDEKLDDPELAERSAREQRILLTRDVGLLKRACVVHGGFVRTVHVEDQLAEILTRFDLVPWLRPFERCPVCNGLVARVEKSVIEHELRPLTRDHFDEFFQCGDCDRLYWRGSHFERMNERVSLFRDSKDRNTPRLNAP